MKIVEQPRFSSDSYLHDIIREMEGELENTISIHPESLSRRSFLKLSGIAGGGLALAFYFGSKSSAVAASSATGSAGEFIPNAFIHISTGGSILIYNKGPEIGQGIKTAFPLIIAEELDAKWEDVVVDQAPVNPAVYGRQSAGGSRSIPGSWDQLRRAGAVARAMLISAAAQQWGVPASECATADSAVMHEASGRKLDYGELADKAAELPVPDENSVRLKPREEYRLLGKWYTGVENKQVVTGQPLFGIDQAPPSVLYAAYEKCPATGGRVREANLNEIKALPGVKDAFVIEGNGRTTELMPGVAIVATTTWGTFEAKKKLRVTWDESDASKDSWTGLVTKAKEVASQPAQETLSSVGDVEAAFAQTENVVEGFYQYPFVSHATFEPQNCTAWYRDGALEIWIPSQTADRASRSISSATGVPEDKITLHQTRCGGGFGRRLMNDYACEAAAIAMKVNAPVKLTWTREDDMAHDFYRVGGFHAFKGAVDDAGKLVAFQDHFITFSGDGQRTVSGGNMSAEEFPTPVIPNARIMQTMLPLATPCGPWRAPRSNSVAWAVHSFLHELSAAAGRDHVEFLLDLMGEPRELGRGFHTGRAAAAIKLAAEKAGWGKSLPERRGLGLAFYYSHSGHFAEVADVSVDADKKLTVHRIVVVGDIGPIINMSGAANQCEGGAVDGFSTMLGLEITMENGRMQQSNFHQYPILRIPNAPQVDVHFIQSEYDPTGVGEPALPPAAPAICNAIFAACGHRIRTMPITKEGFSV